MKGHNVSIAMTAKYIHITHFAPSGRPGYTKSYRNDKISQYSRNRVYALAHSKATRTVVNQNGVTQYFIDKAN